VTVWSEEGLGSTFTLRIPLAAAPPAGRPDPEQHPEQLEKERS
jgi:two-component system sensor histidine kinase SenX3